MLLDDLTVTDREPFAMNKAGVTIRSIEAFAEYDNYVHKLPTNASFALVHSKHL